MVRFQLPKQILALTLLFSLPLAAQKAADEKDADLETEDAKSAEEQVVSVRLRDRIHAVSNTAFLKAGRFELEPLVGVSVSDAFYRRWTVGARAGFHLIESLSLEVGGAYNVFSQELKPLNIIGAGQEGVKDEYQTLGYADAGVTFSPFYGKVAIMSEWIVRFDFFGSLGAGITLDATGSPVDPALEVGGGVRIFLNKWIATRVGVRDYINIQDGDLRNLVLVNAGVSMFFPFDNDDKKDASDDDA